MNRHEFIADRALGKIIDEGVEIIHADLWFIKFIYNNELVEYNVLEDTYAGKSIISGKGLYTLLEQIGDQKAQPTNQTPPTTKYNP